MIERLKCVSAHISMTDWKRLCGLLEARKLPLSQWLRSLISTDMDRMEAEQAERHASVS